jgi:hypothetical protein
VYKINEYSKFKIKEKITMKMFTVLMALMFSVVSMAADAKQKTYKVGWSNYPSWMLFSFEDVIKKHADKAGVSIKVVKVNDYIETYKINQDPSLLAKLFVENFGFIKKIVCGIKTEDTQCGFKLFTR